MVFRNRIFSIMEYLNFIILLFISLLISLTTVKIAETGYSAGFITELERLPLVVPWKIPVVTMLCYFMLIFCMKINGFQGMTRKYSYLITAAEIFAIIVSGFMLNFSYNGILLFTAASLISNLRDNSERIKILVLFCILFVFFDYSVCGRLLNILSLQDYMSYYSCITQSLVLAGVNLLISFNFICFIAYIVSLFYEEIVEKKRIKIINDELNKVNDELKAANKELEIYAKQMAAMTRTQERNRLAREIHDTLGHTLTGIIAGVDACMTLMQIAPEEAKKQLTVVGDVARKGMKEVRRSVNALRPDVLEQGDLLTAIEKMIEEMCITSKVQIFLDNKIDVLKFNDDEEDAVYRIIQECVTNAVRHGKAEKIHITMEKHGCMVTLCIKDNGIGAENINPGFGLTHMKERLDMLKGELEFDGSDGFTVKAKIPIRWGEEYD